MTPINDFHPIEREPDTSIISPLDDYGSVKTAPQNFPLTAFGDLRVAELSPFFQVSFEYTVTNTEIGEIGVSGSGTVTQAYYGKSYFNKNKVVWIFTFKHNYSRSSKYGR